jgi:DmsE family decaheme c-type cytochrome
VYLLAAILLTVLASAASAQPVNNNGYAGSTVCKTCHGDVWLKFYKNPHFKSIASGKELPDHTGCEGCHGPGQSHVQAHGGKATIVAFSQLQPQQVLDKCLTCHAEALSRANVRRSTHTRNDVVCTNCHSIHKADTPKFLLARQQTDLCYGCHSAVRAQFSLPFKHRVNEGSIQCTDCHNPHGNFDPTWRLASRPRQVDQAQANEEACLKCHAEKRGPFVFEHPPVRVEGCEACHMPHGSPNSRLLKRPVVFTMCLECHTGTGTFGRTGTGDPSPSKHHNLADPRYRNCTNCHVQIHGSNADGLFFR